MRIPTKFPEGSASGDRPTEAACIRALDAYLQIGAKADRVIHELEQLTPLEIPRPVLDPEDSAAIAIRDAVSASPAFGGPAGGKKSKLGG